MKKSALLLSLIVLLSFSCDKKYKFYAFYIEKTVEFEFSEGSVGEFEISQEVNVYIDNIWEKYGTEAELVEEITIEEVKLSEADFSHFNSVELFISAESFTETGLASNDTIDINEGVFLNPSNELMDDFVKSPKFNIKTSGLLSGSYSPSFKINFNLRFLVKTYVK